jgi:hypothetical protein
MQRQNKCLLHSYAIVDLPFFFFKTRDQQRWLLLDDKFKRCNGKRMPYKETSNSLM